LSLTTHINFEYIFYFLLVFLFVIPCSSFYYFVLFRLFVCLFFFFNKFLWLVLSAGCLKLLLRVMSWIMFTSSYLFLVSFGYFIHVYQQSHHCQIMRRMLMLVLWYDTVSGHGLWNIENSKKPSLDKIVKSGW